MTQPLDAYRRILVIKLGALGDFVQAMGPAAAIRRAHPSAKITLLTTKAYADLGRAAPYFDEVWIDKRPKFLDVAGWIGLARQLWSGGFERVYDLQTSDRSSFYYRLLGRVEWSGIAAGSSHPHANPNRDHMHTLDRQRDQLRMAGIEDVPPPDLSWAARQGPGLDLPERFLLMVPGGSAHRPEKRWPVESYGELAAWAEGKGIATIILGGDIERPLALAIRTRAPRAIDLTGRTSFGEIVGLAARAVHAVGNDTGPMHLAAAGGAPSTVLYSAASDPALTQPYGASVTVLRRGNLSDLKVEEVAATLAIR